MAWAYSYIDAGSGVVPEARLPSQPRQQGGERAAGAPRGHEVNEAAGDRGRFAAVAMAQALPGVPCRPQLCALSPLSRGEVRGGSASCRHGLDQFDAVAKGIVDENSFASWQ